MTKLRRRCTLFALAALILLLTSGCMGGPRSETIVIPGTDDDQMNSGATTGQSFRVKTIYRLPASAANGAQLLGWANNADLVALSAESRAATSTGLQLQRLAPPYEQFQPMEGTVPAAGWYALSPDGTRTAFIAKAKTGTELTLASLTDGKSAHMAAPPNGQWQMLSGSLSWSNNGRFVSYLVVSAEERGQLRIVVCDTVDRTAELYPLTGLQSYGELIKVALSDDGSGALIDTGKTVAFAKRNGDGYAVQYDRPSGFGESAWVGESQFAFLGSDGTLFQYDIRNGELSVLLEKVDSFRLSADRKSIAYTQDEKDTIFAGKLQGNNILYSEAVYQGVYPLRMDWSPDGGALLVDGRKRYAHAAAQGMPAVESNPVVDQLPFIIRFRS